MYQRLCCFVELRQGRCTRQWQTHETVSPTVFYSDNLLGLLSPVFRSPTSMRCATASSASSLVASLSAATPTPWTPSHSPSTTGPDILTQDWMAAIDSQTRQIQLMLQTYLMTRSAAWCLSPLVSALGLPVGPVALSVCPIPPLLSSPLLSSPSPPLRQVQGRDGGPLPPPRGLSRCPRGVPLLRRP